MVKILVLIVSRILIQLQQIDFFKMTLTKVSESFYSNFWKKGLIFYSVMLGFGFKYTCVCLVVQIEKLRDLDS